MTDSIIPPVTAGTINSSLDIEYHGRRESGYTTATSEHAWQFDCGAYAEQTELDLGGDYPYIAQENGHTLRLLTEITVSERGGDNTYSITIERKAVRGITRHERVFWTACGHYSLAYNDSDGRYDIDHESQEKQPYRIREYDEDVDHRDIFRRSGSHYESLYAFLNEIHSRPHGESPLTVLAWIIRRDSPDDAISADDYEHPVDGVTSLGSDSQTDFDGISEATGDTDSTTVTSN